MTRRCRCGSIIRNRFSKACAGCRRVRPAKALRKGKGADCPRREQGGRTPYGRSVFKKECVPPATWKISPPDEIMRRLARGGQA